MCNFADVSSISEIKSLTVGIEQATSRGASLVRFFNSTDDASSLKSHNDNLDRLITEATVSQSTSQLSLYTKHLFNKLVVAINIHEDVHSVLKDFKVR